MILLIDLRFLRGPHECSQIHILKFVNIYIYFYSQKSIFAISSKKKVINKEKKYAKEKFLLSLSIPDSMAFLHLK